jgi:DNA polymerase-3 subunit gamma/tau
MSNLYSLYYPKNFSSVAGQEKIVALLVEEIKKRSIHSAYLFSGIGGNGKTSVARIMAKAINCVDDSGTDCCNICGNCKLISEGASLDIVEIDGASNRASADIKGIKERLYSVPTQLRKKIYIIDEAERLDEIASDALLKLLREPSDHAVFILCSKKAEDIPELIVAECEKINFERIGVNAIRGRLLYICTQEKIQSELGALHIIAQMAQGSLRDAIVSLEKLGSYGTSLTETGVRQSLGLVEPEMLAGILHSCYKGDAASALRIIERANGKGASMQFMASTLSDFSRQGMLLNMGNSEGEEFFFDSEFTQKIKTLSSILGNDFLTISAEIWTKCLLEMRQSSEARSILETSALHLAWEGRKIIAEKTKKKKAIALSESKVQKIVPSPIVPLVEVIPEETKEPPKVIAADLQKVWAELIDILQQKNEVQARAGMSSGIIGFVEQENDIVIVMKHKNIAARMREREIRRAIEETFSELLNQKVNLYFTADPGGDRTIIPFIELKKKPFVSKKNTKG